jgi:hypothetical protein
MPSKSKAQHNLMAMVANNPKAAKRLGIPQSVGAEFMKKDKGKKKYAMGGLADTSMRGSMRPIAPSGAGPAVGLANAAMRSGREMPTAGGPASPGATGLANAAMRSGREMPMTGPRFAKGGKVTRADGICKKGHTKGKMV